VDIAGAELEAAKREMAAKETNATRTMDTLQTIHDQTDLRISDLKREAYEFKRCVPVLYISVRLATFV
jgi:hypothetical protein